MSMTAWCDSTKSTSSSIIVMPTEENSQTGFKMLSMALFVTVLIFVKVLLLYLFEELFSDFCV